MTVESAALPCFRGPGKSHAKPQVWHIIVDQGASLHALPPKSGCCLHMTCMSWGVHSQPSWGRCTTN